MTTARDDHSGDHSDDRPDRQHDGQQDKLTDERTDDLKDERWVAVNGARLHVVLVGSGPELLMLNGIGANCDMWGPLVQRLQLTRRLILIDMPGAGQSPPLRHPVRMSTLATMVMEAFDALGLPCVDLLGYSWGGALSQQIAHDHPGRVGRLCLVSTIPGWGGLPPLLPRTMLMPTLMQTLMNPTRPGQLLTRPDPQHRPTARGYCQQLYAIAGWSSVWWLRRIRARTLILCGDEDPLVPIQNVWLMGRLIPDASVHTAQGGDHFWLLDHAEESARVIEHFLSADRAL